MKKVSLIALLLAVSFVNDATAGKKADGAAYKAEWQMDKHITCAGNGADAGFDGSKNNIKTDNSWHKYLRNNFMVSDTMAKGVEYYIATEMYEFGAKFCRIVVGGERSGANTRTITWYFYADGKADGADCFTLCKPGHYGDGCTATTFTDTSEPSMQHHKDRLKYATGKFRTISVSPSGSNIEESIPMFWHGVDQQCSGGTQVNLTKMTKMQEHDAVLAIKEINLDETAKKVTYSVQPLVVRAGGAKGFYKADSGAWPMLTWAGKLDSTMCPAGFMSVESGGCIGYSADVAASQDLSDAEQVALAAAIENAKSIEASGLDLLCPGFDKSKYKNTQHVLNSESFRYTNWREAGNAALTKDEFINKRCSVLTGDNLTACQETYGKAYDNAFKEGGSATCTVFVCKDGKGYKSDPTVSGDFTCVSCTSNDDATIHPSRLGVGTNGVCLTCKLGEVFNDGVCEPAKQIHKAYMAGDVKKGDLGKKLDASKQCWTKPTPDEYKSCMDNNGWGMYASSANDGGGDNPPKGSEPSL